MGKNLSLFIFMLFLNTALHAQVTSPCEKCLKEIAKSSSDYKQKFEHTNIFTAKYVTDGLTKGDNYFFTIYYDNKKAGVFNRMATYKLNTKTKQLASEVLGTDKFLPVTYNKKLALNIKQLCKESFSEK